MKKIHIFLIQCASACVYPNPGAFPSCSPSVWKWKRGHLLYSRYCVRLLLTSLLNIKKRKIKIEKQWVLCRICCQARQGYLDPTQQNGAVRWTTKNCTAKITLKHWGFAHISARKEEQPLWGLLPIERQVGAFKKAKPEDFISKVIDEFEEALRVSLRFDCYNGSWPECL